MHPWLVVAPWPGSDSTVLRVPTYFACLMVGFALATFVLRREARARGLPVRAVMDLALWTVPAVLIGARLAHVALVEPAFFAAHPREVLRIAEGGFVFYGGMAAGAAVLFGLAPRLGLGRWVAGDVFAPATAFGLVFGRLGCLGGGCCFGKPIAWPTGIAWPWGLRYFHRGHVPDALLATSLHPTPLYEALGCLALFVALGRWRARRDGELVLLWVAGYGLLRSAVEVFRADAVRGLYLGGWASTSQIIGLGSAAAALAVWTHRRRRVG